MGRRYTALAFLSALLTSAVSVSARAPAVTRRVIKANLTVSGTQAIQHKRIISHLARPVTRQGVPLGQGFWSVRGTNFVDSNGHIVKFSGVTWSGFETPRGVFGGLKDRSYQDHFDHMAALGFNMLRLPFAGDTLKDDVMPWDGTVDANPDLKGLSSLQIMDKMIDACTQRGIKVILDYHRMAQTWDNEIGTWWDGNHTEETWLNNWAKLAKRYKGNPTIVGADLFNEIHSSDKLPDGAPMWVEDAGKLEKYNFRRATLKAIEAIHAEEPNWIIFMEGMWNGPYWWGGNCAEMLKAPIKEPATKLAYSAHDYGPYVAQLGWFWAKDFPKNLVPLYKEKWGVIVEKGIAPLWIGEFGSFFPGGRSDLNTRERLVFQHQVAYIGQLGASWTIAFWGPDTKDTGSILRSDWKTVNKLKMDLLKPIMHPNFS